MPTISSRLTYEELEEGRREMQAKYGGDYWIVAADDGFGSAYFINMDLWLFVHEYQPTILMRDRLAQLHAPPPSNVEVRHGR